MQGGVAADIAGGQPYGDLRQRPWRLQAGDHIFCLYESEEEHRFLVSSFLRHSKERCDKTLHIVKDHTAYDTELILHSNHLHPIHFQQIRRQPDTKSLTTANRIFGFLVVSFR